jgi:hypothetical protein
MLSYQRGLLMSRKKVTNLLILLILTKISFLEYYLKLLGYPFDSCNHKYIDVEHKQQQI